MPRSPGCSDSACRRLPDQVFAFIGAKGGVGTTTTAVNVATALTKLSKGPTLLVDLHLAYGDAAVFLSADAAILRCSTRSRTCIGSTPSS